MTALGDILLSLETGKRPRGGAVKDPSGVLSISAEHMDETGSIDTSIPRFVHNKGFYETMTTGHLQTGDVLVVKDGATTGKTAYVNASLRGEVLVANEHVFVCRTFLSSLDPLWMFYCLWSDYGRSQIRACLRGSAQGGIIRSFVDDVSLPLPPLPEQQRIVAEIEKHLTRLDASVTVLKRVQANLKRYRASVLKAACEGKLVPTEADLARAEGRAYEPADVLLERILDEHRARWESQKKRRGKYKEPVAPDTTGLPELPLGWTWGTVEQLLARSEYGTSVKCSYEAEGLPVLRIPNIVAGEIDLSNIKYATRSLSIDAENALAKGDVLMCRTNGSVSLVGKTAIVNTELEQLHGFASYLLRFRLV